MKKMLLASLIVVHCFLMQTASANNTKWVVPVAGGTVAVVAGGYATGYCGGTVLLHYLKKWYVPDYEKLETDPGAFIPYVKEKHHENYFLWIDLNGSMSNFPLLKYKFDLDSYIRLVHFLRFFVGSTARNQIDDLIKKMKKLREAVINHADFKEENRLYIKLQAVPNVYVNNFGR